MPYFIKANDADGIRDAVEKFSAKLGEFYGILHRNNIGYHSESSEHCTLVDITIAGNVMDIGGLSQDNSVDSHSEAYFAQNIKTTNLLSYLCTHILRVDETTLKSALDVFWEKYKNLYVDENIEYFSSKTYGEPQKIRTQYFDTTTGEWVKIASDLQDIAFAGPKKVLEIPPLKT